jgi:exosortase A
MNAETGKTANQFQLHTAGLNPAHLLLTLLAGMFVLAYFPVLEKLVSSWSSSDDYSHGFAIIPLSVYLLWRNRETLAHTSVKPSWVGIPVILAGLALYLFARLAEIETAASFSFIPSLAGVIIFLFGFGLFRCCIFPLSLLLFMIPVPAQIYSALTIPLQIFVSKMATAAASLAGIPIYREGNVIHLPQQTLQVVQACSGLRSLTAMMALGAVFAYLTVRSNPLRGVLFLSAIPVAIVVNILRVLIMIAAFYYAGFDLAREPAHTLFGLFIFACAVGLFLCVKGVICRWDK